MKIIWPVKSPETHLTEVMSPKIYSHEQYTDK